MMRVLFVCTANICRSPMAEGAFRKRLAETDWAHQVEVDSAGTHARPGGSPPDRRAQEVASSHGIAIGHLRSRRISALDFIYFDLILAMDHGHVIDLERQCPPGERHRIHLLMELAADVSSDEVPDPYFGPARGFERVMSMVEQGSEGLLREVSRHLNRSSSGVWNRVAQLRLP